MNVFSIIIRFNLRIAILVLSVPLTVSTVVIILTSLPLICFILITFSIIRLTYSSLQNSIWKIFIYFGLLKQYDENNNPNNKDMQIYQPIPGNMGYPIIGESIFFTSDR